MQQIARSIALVYNNLPRLDKVILGSLAVITLAISIARPFLYQTREDKNTAKNIHTDNKQLCTLTTDDSKTLYKSALKDEMPSKSSEDKKDDSLETHNYVVASGDNISSILTQFGIDISGVSALAKYNPELYHLKKGDTISWVINDKSELQKLSWKENSSKIRTYNLIRNNFKEVITFDCGNRNNHIITGALKGNFVNSARTAGIKMHEINTIIKVLQWQMDFRKLHTGDQFAVLISHEYKNNRSEQSKLLGVRMRTGGKDYYAVRAQDGKFYDRQGSSLTQGFMRFPTRKKFRISSRFNPLRINPVTGHMAPHRGIDFAMPVGTPVFAVGDGEVMIARHGGAAGNYVVVRHGHQYKTRFMHLKRILVKPGQKVKRGEPIALSGNTGRSTGPHLHYEFWLNNHAINPLTAQLPCSYRLLGKTRKNYLALVRQVIPLLIC
ncbi:murein DD-endopeptidase MepM [Candidatus Profftia tarda]|uniref:Murein DD-endopeptidase MepM n=1 Tax=Candidatus Profftia tarda TaxID=1177216 RepID=A0A8E4EYK3_9ENTR|nr:murein DD-endopeptidase MepM [Candidatus Profftia tarda]CAD6511092.1 Murein DD-endopeptidase MepM [Candidatus Profftia tarda]